MMDATPGVPGVRKKQNENDYIMRPDDLQTTTWYFEQNQVDDLRPERLGGVDFHI